MFDKQGDSWDFGEDPEDSQLMAEFEGGSVHENESSAFENVTSSFVKPGNVGDDDDDYVDTSHRLSNTDKEIISELATVLDLEELEIVIHTKGMGAAPISLGEIARKWNVRESYVEEKFISLKSKLAGIPKYKRWY